MFVGAFTLDRGPASALADQDDLYRLAKGDPAMQRAINRARDTFADFLAKQAAPPAGARSFAVKLDLSAGRGVSEFVWLNPFVVRGQDIVGAIANTPRIRTDFKKAQIVDVDRDDIVDWMYRDGPSVKGNFTGCALLAHKSRSDREAIEQRLGLSCSALSDGPP